MRSQRDSTSAVPPNAFAPDFLSALRERDEPAGANEADLAGPWSVQPHPDGGFAVLREWEKAAEGDLATAVFSSRELALLTAAVLPASGRAPLFRLRRREDEAGFAVESGGEVVGYLRYFDVDVLAALHVAALLARSPQSLAMVLEAAGSSALEKSGRLLRRQVGSEG